MKGLTSQSFLPLFLCFSCSISGSSAKNPCPGDDGGAASVDGGALDASMVDGEAIDRAID